MAAYASTTTLDQLRAQPIGKGIGVIYGTVDVTNYNATVAEITDITEKFRGTPTVLLASCSDNGFLGSWDDSGLAVKCWAPTSAGAGAGTECSTDDDAGAFQFMAIGRM